MCKVPRKWWGRHASSRQSYPHTRVYFSSIPFFEQLTNPQADIIASSSDNVQLMLNALEVPKPNLVIELLPSGGFRDYTTILPSGAFGRAMSGILHGRPPFLSDEDEQETESKIDMMMVEVIIPLAAQNRAVVLCDPCPGNCILSASFLRMYSAVKAKWSGPPPFTVICVTNDVDCFYLNFSKDAHWKNVRKESRAWRQRDAKIVEHYGTEAYKKKLGPGKKIEDYSMNHDLDPNASCVIMTDQIDQRRNRADARPIISLGRELVRHLSDAVPSIAIRTGFSSKGAEVAATGKSGLGIVSARAQAGTPVLALDVRTRSPLTFAPGTELKARREALIESAKTQLVDWRERLLEEKEGKPPLAETLDVCTLAFLHEALNGDGGASESKKSKSSFAVGMPLHEAIRRAQDEESSAMEGDGSLPPATPEQIAELARWHTNGVFSDAWKVHEDREDREANGDTIMSIAGRSRISAQETLARLLLSSPNFYHASLSDMESVQKIVNQIVRLDRLPHSNTLQGLLLLRDAWSDYDVRFIFTIITQSMPTSVIRLNSSICYQ